jgi:DNA-binding FadR family transcriptional regulator
MTTSPPASSAIAELLGGHATSPALVDRRSTTQVVVEKLILLIATGVLREGDALPSERELANVLSVSRDTVRGAIRLLAGKGIVDIAHGARTRIINSEVDSLVPAGSAIREIDRYPLEDVRRARELIELEVVSEAAKRIGAADIAFLRQSLARQKAADGDAVRFLIADRDFHQTIYRASGNAMLADTAIGLYAYMMGYRRRVMSDPAAIAQSIAQHEGIVDALEAHDPEAAIAAFGAHLARIHASTRDLLRRASDEERRAP